MTIDRSIGWARQGYDHPAPWGESIPDDWADTTFTFTSRVATPTRNALGGFRGSATPVTIATLQGRAELVTESGMALDVGAPVERRFYRLYIGLPLPEGQGTPRKGQRVTFTDPLGEAIDVSVDHVDVPEGIADHLEIRTEDIT